jgi:hypothetical protein
MSAQAEKFETTLKQLCTHVATVVKLRPRQTWDQIPVKTLAHVLLMKAYRIVDSVENGKLDEDSIADLIAYATKIYQRMGQHGSDVDSSV